MAESNNLLMPVENGKGILTPGQIRQSVAFRQAELYTTDSTEVQRVTEYKACYQGFKQDIRKLGAHGSAVLHTGPRVRNIALTSRASIFKGVGTNLNEDARIFLLLPFSHQTPIKRSADLAGQTMFSASTQNSYSMR
jgi:hypothetical protein